MTSASAEYPRVVIFGGGFDSYSGGGVTLSNLFRGWPPERLGVIDHTVRGDSHALAGAEYLLGASEQRWAWPLSLVPTRSHASGRVDRSSRPSDTVPVSDLSGGVSPSSPGTRSRAARAAFRRVDSVLGLEGLLRHSALSESLTSWVADFSPDVLYCHFSSLETLRLVRGLHERTGAGLVIHMMDDWPETVYGGTLTGPALRAVVDRELRGLFRRAAVRMAISGAMADEYLARYDCEFEVFHNCIDAPRWKESRKTSWVVDVPLTIVYAGRIGWDALASFRDVCDAVELLNQGGLPVQFCIHCPGLDAPGSAVLGQYPHTVIRPAVDHEQLFGTLAGADVLMVPSDFEGRGRRFARLSMPTKIPAYMASGTPVVLYAPRSHAMCVWAEQAGCARIVGERGVHRLAHTLLDLAASPVLREALGRKAGETADRQFDGTSVRAAFREALARGTGGSA